MSYLDKTRDCTIRAGNFQTEYKVCSKKPWEVKRIIHALSNGRMIYDTGRKMGTAKVYEQLSEDGRKLMGLEPLDNFLPNWRELLPSKAELDWKKTQSIKAIRKREEESIWTVI